MEYSELSNRSASSVFLLAMGSKIRSAAALARRAEKKAQRVAEKNSKQILLKENWICNYCNNDNFARRIACNRCGEPNPVRNESLLVKKERPRKLHLWNKNPTNEQQLENIRLRDLLEKEKQTGILCPELIGENRKRAEVMLARLNTKRMKKAKKSKTDSVLMDTVKASDEKAARKAAKKRAKEIEPDSGDIYNLNADSIIYALKSKKVKLKYTD